MWFATRTCKVLVAQKISVYWLMCLGEPCVLLSSTGHWHLGMDPQLRWPVIQLCFVCLSRSSRLVCSHSQGARKWVQTGRPLWIRDSLSLFLPSLGPGKSESEPGWGRRKHTASLERETAGIMEASAWGQARNLGCERARSATTHKELGS